MLQESFECAFIYLLIYNDELDMMRLINLYFRNPLHTVMDLAWLMFIGSLYQQYFQ